MSETSTETSTEAEGLAPVPADVDENHATGYAVFDTTLGQFVGSVVQEKPSKAQAAKAVRKGHQAAVVRV